MDHILSPPHSAITNGILALLAGGLCLLIHQLTSFKAKTKSIPLTGTRSIYEPRLFASYRFFRNAKHIVDEGYSRFKHEVFRFMRNDADMLVVPVDYIDELNRLPATVANPTAAHVHNLFGPYTGVDLLLESNLHIRMIQNKITPILTSLAGPMEDELSAHINETFPKQCEESWTVINPYYTLLSLIARMSARIFVGPEFCRNPEWIDISIHYTENIFVSVVAMRLFPSWTHPLLSFCLPSMWKGSSFLKRAKRLLVPEFQRRLDARQAGTYGQKYKDEESTILSNMAQHCRPSEQNAEKLAHLEVVLALASIHTTQMTAVHVIYDLAAHPEYADELLEEITQAFQEADTDAQEPYSRMQKLDSFMRESQRMNPPSILAYHRIMEQSHVLSDGTLLPQGAHVCMAANAIQNDPDVTSNPAEFDPFRSYRLRQRPGESQLHQFSRTEKNVLNFGHGKAACPGRFFASLEVKILLAKLIMKYDFKLLDGEKRPVNQTAHEFIFPDMEAKILARARRNAENTKS